MQARIQPLNSTPERGAFRCGHAELDRWLAEVAGQHQLKDLSRTFVLASLAEPDKILGFYSLATSEIPTGNFPPGLARKRPRVIPVARMGRLAVDGASQGKGYGETLLLDALKRVESLSASIGINAVVVDAKDDDAARFYSRYGFTPLSHHPLTLVMPLTLVRQLGS